MHNPRMMYVDVEVYFHEFEILGLNQDRAVSFTSCRQV
jgi:hypothetical protein